MFPARFIDPEQRKNGTVREALLMCRGRRGGGGFLHAKRKYLVRFAAVKPLLIAFRTTGTPKFDKKFHNS